MKITCLICVHNEIARLPFVMQHARQWADEVLVIDKGSTDGTAELVRNTSAAVGAVSPLTHHPSPIITLKTVPYAPAGDDDMPNWIEFAAHDWVFVMTAGEVPTRELIQRVKALLAERGDTLDLVMIPKKLWSFGIHDRRSPWSASLQPFLIHRRRAAISRQIHRNFSLKPGGKSATIDYSETCHVAHPTHKNAAAFLKSHFDYILAEAATCEDPQRLLHLALFNLKTFDFGNAPELFGQMCAWRVYWLGCALVAHEKLQNRNVPAEYLARTKQMLAAEWGGNDEG